MDGLGYTGATVEEQLFSVYSSLVFIDQCFCLFQPIKAITGIGTTESGNLLKSLVDRVHCWFSHFSNLFLSSFFCSLSSFILFLSSFCLSMSKCSLSILSCFSHCFCKAARIEESLLPTEGL